MTDPETQGTYRFLLVLWVAMFLGVGGNYLLTRLVTPADEDPASPLIYPLLGTAVGTTSLSFAVKALLGGKTLARVRAGSIAAFAMVEAASLLGLLIWFVAAWANSWIFFVISGCGLLMHFPRRPVHHGR